MNARNVVATVHNLGGLRIASRLEPSDVDVIEMRVDSLLADGLTEGEIANATERLHVPVLITVRHPAEGGLGALQSLRRRELLERFCAYATLIDVELRSAASLATVISEAKASGIRVVVSDHHFSRTPSLADLLDRQRRAVHAGADIFKLATLTSTPREMARLLEFSATPAPCPHAVMGMGEFGLVSRLALAKAGSVLNYGYLDEPNAPGQWEARELRQLITKIEAGAP